MMDTPTIGFDDFEKVDIRAGLIVAAETVPRSEKLLRLQVDFGDLGTRQVLAGIAKSYSVASLVGLTAAFVVNLAPRKMMGLDSHGMILAGENVAATGGVSVALLGTAVRPGTKLG